MTQKRPNIILLMADDHRSDAIAAHGNPTVKTPNMDKLIQNGTDFVQNWHTGSYSGAVCIAARAALHTGTNVYQSSIHKDYRDCNQPDVSTIRPDRVTLGQALGENGYKTHFVGKWHNDRVSINRSYCDGAQIFFGGMSDHYAVPAQDYDPTGTYDKKDIHITPKHSTELFTDAALDFLGQYDGDAPYFLTLAFTSPHDPRQAPQKFADMYKAADMPLPENFKQHEFDQGHNKLRDEVLANFPRDADEIRQHIADYYAIISHQDHHMGLIMEAVEKRGDLENTIIIYTADHGLTVGQQGLMGKQNMYEASLKIPLIISGPGIPSGLKITELTQTPDLFPTLMELLDIPTPNSVTAKSLAQVLQGQSSQRSHQFSLYHDMQRAVNDGQFKLIRYYKQDKHNNGSPGCDKVQLFNLKTDPWETTDLYGQAQYMDIMQGLVDALQTQMNTYDDALKNVPILI